MRLIDADVVVKDIADLMLSPWFCAKEGFHWRKEAVEIVRDLCVIKTPTVEAIPIEWLQAKADSWNAELKTACPEDAETIRHIQQKYLGIIEEWRKEHETC